MNSIVGKDFFCTNYCISRSQMNVVTLLSRCTSIYRRKKNTLPALKKTPDNRRYYYNTDAFHCKLFLVWKQFDIQSLGDNLYQINLIHSFHEQAREDLFL